MTQERTAADVEPRVPGLRVPPEIAASRPRHRRSAGRLYPRLVTALAVADALAAEVGVVICWALLRGERGLRPTASMLFALAPLVTVSVFWASGLYRVSKLSPAEEFRRIIGAVSVSGVLLGLLANWASRIVLGRPNVGSLAVGWLGAYWLTTLVLVMVERKAWHRFVHRLRRSGSLLHRTVIVGVNEEAHDLARRLKNKSTGLLPVGMVAVDAESRRPGRTGDQLPILGSIDDLPRILSSQQIECLFIASSAMRPESMMRVFRVARRSDVDVRVSANMPEILASRLSVQSIGNVLALSLQTATLSRSQAAVKRLFDLVVAGAGILLTLPIWLVAAALIKATSEGPVLYRQQRVGRAGRPFTMYKFRTMVIDADRRVHELLEGSDRGPLFKLKDDPRITRVGRVLRRWSVDELPQLLNVLRGDMSLVGPRPMPATFDQGSYEEHHLQRLEVLPGITGLWQVSGRSDLTFDECVQLDTFYIENWSIAYDVFILLKTIPAVLRKRGAY